MKKYGDLEMCNENDMNYWKNKILSIIEKDGITDFHSVWAKLCENRNLEQKKLVLYKNAQIIVLPDFEFTAIDWYHFMCGDKIESLDWIKTDQFFDNLLYYANYLQVYKEDIMLGLYYNRALRTRERKKLEIDRFDDIASYCDSEDGNYEFNLPFTLKENKYEDFCAYTWKALFKDVKSVECFKKTAGEKRQYVNTKSFSRITYTLTCREKISPTDCDRWLIEKIFGTSTVIALLPTVIDCHDKQVMDYVIIPAINRILMCKPVKIRMALADLVCKFLHELPSIDEKSPYNDTRNNMVYAKETVEKMLGELESVVKEINKRYIGVLAAFYKIIRTGKVDFEYIEGIPITMKTDLPQLYVSELDWVDNDRDSDTRKREIDRMVNGLFFNQIGLTEVYGKLLKYPQKRNYNDSDPLWGFATMQKAALDTNYRLYHDKK